eukprot:GCRY01001439.1.p1 GENE.GCRY01001439.1~~GCRY01001439.1.p1  ORF type:complete len:680 (+),score=173.97 GCRY01001439.1:145-2184(+)
MISPFGHFGDLYPRTDPVEQSDQPEDFQWREEEYNDFFFHICLLYFGVSLLIVVLHFCVCFWRRENGCCSRGNDGEKKYYTKGQKRIIQCPICLFFLISLVSIVVFYFMMEAFHTDMNDGLNTFIEGAVAERNGIISAYNAMKNTSSIFSSFNQTLQEVTYPTNAALLSSSFYNETVSMISNAENFQSSFNDILNTWKVVLFVAVFLVVIIGDVILLTSISGPSRSTAIQGANCSFFSIAVLFSFLGIVICMLIAGNDLCANVDTLSTDAAGSDLYLAQHVLVCFEPEKAAAAYTAAANYSVNVDAYLAAATAASRATDIQLAKRAADVAAQAQDLFASLANCTSVEAAYSAVHSSECGTIQAASSNAVVLVLLLILIHIGLVVLGFAGGVRFRKEKRKKEEKDKEHKSRFRQGVFGPSTNTLDENSSDDDVTKVLGRKSTPAEEAEAFDVEAQPLSSSGRSSGKHRTSTKAKSKSREKLVGEEEDDFYADEASTPSPYSAKSAEKRSDKANNNNHSRSKSAAAPKKNAKQKKQHYTSFDRHDYYDPSGSGESDLEMAPAQGSSTPRHAAAAEGGDVFGSEMDMGNFESMEEGGEQPLAFPSPSPSPASSKSVYFNEPSSMVDTGSEYSYPQPPTPTTATHSTPTPSAAPPQETNMAELTSTDFAELDALVLQLDEQTQ